MKADQKKQCDYILDRLRKGQERAEILQQFSKVFKNDTTRTFDNRLKIARAQFDSESERIKQEAEKGIEKDIEALKSKIMAPVERQVILADSIRDFEDKLAGRKPFTFFQGQKIVNSHNGGVFMLPIDTQTSVKKVIRELIAELNKMGGDYAATKSEVKLDAPMAFIVKTTDTELAKDAEDFK